MENKTFTKATVTAGERTRDELYLPVMYFPAVDPLLTGNWLQELGEKSFCMWLQLLTLVDRTNGAKDKYGNQDTIPNSLEGLMKTLGMSKPKFYRIIKPLWNYGMIDIVEWQEHKKVGQKAVNIIVYPYPQNNIELARKPLVEVRDYDKDYVSNGRTYGKLAADYHKAVASEKEVAVENENNSENHRYENVTVRKYSLSRRNPLKSNRYKNVTVDGNENVTVTVTKSLPINITNTLVNNSNTLVNNSNNSFEEEEENNNIYIGDIGKIENEQEQSQLNEIAASSSEPSVIVTNEMLEAYRQKDVKYGLVIELFVFYNLHPSFMLEVLAEVERLSLKNELRISEIRDQLQHIVKKIEAGETIYEFVTYFMNGLQTRITNRQFADKQIPVAVPAKSKEVSPGASHGAGVSTSRPKTPFYDWLKERA